MIPQSTLDAATRVADYAARRPVVLDMGLLPAPPPDDHYPLAMKGDAPRAGIEEPDPQEQHPQDGSGDQRIISAYAFWSAT